MVEMTSKIEYNRGVIIETPIIRNSFFCCQKSNTLLSSIWPVLLLEQLRKLFTRLASHSTIQRAFLFGPYTTKKQLSQDGNPKLFFTGVTL